jgi:predicted KAP-like P-loop ATPase
MNSNELILTDTPLQNPEDDRLGFAPFAKNLANTICKVKSKGCLVFALYGTWGSGKTTCLNFTSQYIKERPEAQQPIIIRFSPWWFSGHGNLLQQFFREFCIAI